MPVSFPVIQGLTSPKPFAFRIGEIVQASYNGEENTKQATLEIVNINGQSISAAAASEAFDEPLTKEQVLAIIDPFLVP